MKKLRSGILVGVLIAFCLVLYGLNRFPRTNLRSIIGAISVLLFYGLIGWKGTPRLMRQPPQVVKAAMIAGLLAGAVFVGEVILEYIILPTDNTRLGLVEFGLVFTMYFGVGAYVAWKGFAFRLSVLAGGASAIIASLIWFIAILVCFYLFFGTDRQSQVFRAEGNYDDFRRSGMTDFPTFIMEDFLGAGFFHLLLGPLIAAILASVGGLIGRGLARLRKA
jgi:hypothetical protein